MCAWVGILTVHNNSSSGYWHWFLCFHLITIFILFHQARFNFFVDSLLLFVKVRLTLFDIFSLSSLLLTFYYPTPIASICAESSRVCFSSSNHLAPPHVWEFIERLWNRIFFGESLLPSLLARVKVWNRCSHEMAFLTQSLFCYNLVKPRDMQKYMQF